VFCITDIFTSVGTCTRKYQHLSGNFVCLFLLCFQSNNHCVDGV